MKESLLLGRGKHLVPIPHHIWQAHLSQSVYEDQGRLGFMSRDHHRVRDFVVLEIPRRGRPVALPEIAQEIELPLERTREIVDELERGMTFLFRDAAGDVAWAYPVTAEPTPHRLRFSTGEQIYAA
jgi:hypothetical protein